MTIRDMRYISLPILISELVPYMILKYIKNRGPDPSQRAVYLFHLYTTKILTFKSKLIISTAVYLFHLYATKILKISNLTNYQIKI